MAFIGTALSAAQTLTDALQSFELVEKLVDLGYESELVDLQRTVGAITAVLSDAETKQELSHQAQGYIEELKEAVFEADDLIDEFSTLVQQQWFMDTHGSLIEKLRHFFSTSNPIYISRWMSGGIKDIKKKLDAIAYKNQFSFKIDPEPIRKRRPETCSYVNEVDIIGREDDLDSIVGELLASDVQQDVSFLSIVGIGGLGKTALAQLLYNDLRITSAFALRFWTCVSDQDQEELDVKDILCKILGLDQEFSTMEQVQNQLRAQLADKKYLLVLDDVWTEKRDQWCELAKYFSGVQKGSWIVVTTRSLKTATITGGLIYQLSGLSEENSWHLFERIAFASDISNPSDELIRIGQEIVDGCARVPLAIRVAGSLLYGQEKSKWISVQRFGLANIRDYENGIVPILKLSFHHLESPLKSCFNYCALFPKDYEIKKGMLIRLWMAQGYIVPLDRNQSMEDAGEEYFSILSRRCFFQDIVKDEFGEIKSCKIHDLMHDIAQSVSGKEICALNTISGNVDKKVRHLSVYSTAEYGRYSLCKPIIRSHLFVDRYFGKQYEFPVEDLVASCRCLRALDLSSLKIEQLPGSIGELTHLRYLDVSRNPLVVLPNTITRLYNLQTLKLNHCSRLKELPEVLSRLVKLRVLDIKDCYGLTYMPRGMGNLICLQRLKGEYRVGRQGRCTSWKQWFYGLDDLKALNSLKGELNIWIRWPRYAKNVIEEALRRDGLYLRNKEHLNKVVLNFEDKERDGGIDDDGTRKIMEDLQPHSSLKELTIEGHQGVKLPGWVTLLPQLVRLNLSCCRKLEYLPCLGHMHHLKYLRLAYLVNLEHIEGLLANSSLMKPTLGLASTVEEVLLFFPSLEELHLKWLPKLKGWRRGFGFEENSSSSNKPQLGQQLLPCLSQLKVLYIEDCPELTCIPLCPMMETQTAEEFSERMKENYMKRDGNLGEVTIGNSENTSSNTLVPKLRRVSVDNVALLSSLPMDSFQSIESLKIENDDEMVNLPDWMQYLSTLQFLELKYCNNFTEMPSWMPKLTSLRELSVWGFSDSLVERCQQNPSGEDWPYIQHIPDIYLDGAHATFERHSFNILP